MHDPQVKFSEFMQARNSLDDDASKMRIYNNADDDAHVTGDSSSSSSSSKPQQLHQQQPSWWNLNDRLDDDNRLDAPIPLLSGMLPIDDDDASDYIFNPPFGGTFWIAVGGFRVGAGWVARSSCGLSQCPGIATVEDPMAPHRLLRAGEAVWRHLPPACTPYINIIRRANEEVKDAVVGAASAKAPEEAGVVNMKKWKMVLDRHVYTDWRVYVNLFIQAMRELAMRREGWTTSISEEERRRRELLGDVAVDGIRQSVGFRIMYDHLYFGLGGISRLFEWFARAGVTVLHIVRLNEIERFHSERASLAVGGILQLRRDDDDGTEGVNDKPISVNITQLWQKVRYWRMKIAIIEYNLRALAQGSDSIATYGQDSEDDDGIYSTWSTDSSDEIDKLAHIVEKLPSKIQNVSSPVPPLMYYTALYEDLISSSGGGEIFQKIRAMLRIRACDDMESIEAVRGYFLTAKIHRSVPCVKRISDELMADLGSSDGVAMEEREGGEDSSSSSASPILSSSLAAIHANATIADLAVAARAVKQMQTSVVWDMCKHGNDKAFDAPFPLSSFGSRRDYLLKSFVPPVTRFVVLTTGRSGIRWLFMRSGRALAACLNLVFRDEGMHMLSLWRDLTASRPASSGEVHAWHEALLHSRIDYLGVVEKWFDLMTQRYISRYVESAPPYTPVIGGAVGLRINYSQLPRISCGGDCDRLECGCSRGLDMLLAHLANRGIRVLHAVRMNEMEAMIERLDDESLMYELSKKEKEARERKMRSAGRHNGDDLRRRHLKEWQDERLSEQDVDDAELAELMAHRRSNLAETFVEYTKAKRERVVSVHNATLAVGHLLRARHSAYAVEAGLARMRKSHHLVARTMFMEMFLSDDEASNVAFSALRHFLGMVQDEKGGAESCLHVGTRVNGTSTEPAKVADYLDMYRQTSEALIQDHEKDGCSHRFAPPGVYERILREFKKGGEDFAIRMCVNSEWLVKIRTPAEWTDAIATWRRDMNSELQLG